MKPAAVIFDLDGTLIDTAHDLHAALNWLLARHDRPGVPLEGMRVMVGDGARAMIRHGFAQSGGPPPGDFEDLFHDFLQYYAEHLADSSRPFPGVEDCLARLRQQGVALGVCTNKAERLSRELLSRLGLDGYFGAVLGGDSLPVRKPDGGHVLGTLAALGAAGRPAVMVGDSSNDVKAARAAGLPVVAVTFGYTATPAAALGADVLIDSFADLDATIAGLP